MKTAPSWPVRSTSRSSEKWKGQCKNGKVLDKESKKPRADRKHQDRSDYAAQVHTLCNPGSAHCEILQEIIQQFSWCGVFVISRTRMSRREAPEDGELKGSGVRAQHDSQCARFTKISWGYDGKDRMAGLIDLLGKKRFNSNNMREDGERCA